ncbi:hypothetical protein CDAR_412491 [Caerostris darwini]|uniref:Uncharacterized protein n=1 Tax=Caerostris darwini TaxID=1538125 RepID=A0AAV4QP53_9ARAC|nr:hypothetical protein CDAR_412491 [Caerostris darwini]
MSKTTFHFTKPPRGVFVPLGTAMTPVESLENYPLREILRTNGETLSLALDPSTETAFIYEGPNHPVIKVKPKSPQLSIPQLDWKIRP